MKLRTQKITALMAAAVLGISAFGSVPVTAAESTETADPGGYEWDPVGNLHLKGDRKQKSSYDANWSGLRVSAGIVTYFKMK